jgi:UDP-glucose-4-epimerase GalE
LRTDPVNAYGASKLAVDRMISDECRAHGLGAVSLRYFNVAGASGDLGEDHEPETHLIPLAIGAALGKRPPLEIYGTDYPTPDGTAVRDYVHVSDLADAHVCALRYLQAGGESRAFNLGTGRGHSVREVIAAVERTGKRDVPRRAAARRPGDPASLVAAPGRSRELLGWTPRRSDLDTLVATAWRWHNR